MSYRSIIYSLALLAATSTSAQEGPTMGWSSWNTFGVNISESLIKGQADAMVSKGLKTVGYDHINIDDGYFGGRDSQDGHLLIHPQRFPNGLKGVVDHIHSKGLKAGIYSDAGRNIAVSVNGKKIQTVNVNSGGWDKVGKRTLDIELQKGDNTIRLSNATSWMPDIDYIELTNTTPTTINDIRRHPSGDDAVYNLNGQKTNHPHTKGIYAVGGKLITQ